MSDEKYEEKVAMLRQRVTVLEKRLRDMEEALEISQRRYEIAVGFSDVTIFDYDVKTKIITTQEEDLAVFGMPRVLESGVEEVIRSGIIEERSFDTIRELYRKIDGGADNASATIYANAKDGGEHILELQMVNIFGQDGKPTRAVGVRKDITELVQYRREKEYVSLSDPEVNFIFDANVTQDKILRFDPKWEADMHLEGITSLSAMVREIGENRVNPLDRERFYEKQLPAILTSNFLLGQHRVCFEYRMRVGDKGYLWFEARINLSEDALTGDITMSVYTRNIDREKKNVLRSVLEHSQYERILERSALIYELNITQDTMVYTRETLGDEYTLYSGANFFEAVLPRILDTIHHHDKAAVRSLFSKNALLAAYQRGETDLGVDYRRMNKSGDYRWFHCSLQFFCDPQTNDVIAYAYIEDIHDQKEKERRLIFRAQHDMMTGFYNKDIAAEKIEEYLSSEEGKIGTHAFFIVDLDHFKRFNDIFGHAFGDAVLSQTSSKINTLFRSDDILGRIGGDEFIILMKNVKSEDSISVKARELCDSISDIYEEGGMEFRATVSLGIAISGKHGNCFAELYRHSDTALYASKERGRNRYTIYREEMHEGQTTVKNIDERIILQTATLERDISEYVFRILYEAEDIEQGIHGVMALFGKQYQISRISVFENTEDNSCGENTFHWCAENNPNWEKVRPCFFYGKFPEFSEQLIRDGVVVLKEIDNLSSELLEAMRHENTKSTVILSMMKRGEFRGFVAFDQCDFPVAPDNEQLNDYRNFANVLGLFIMEMRFEQRVKIAFGDEVRPY